MRLTLMLLIAALPAAAQIQEEIHNGNQADRIEWFRDLGFGMFIHWSVDSQLGAVISHSMAGASDDYVNRFVNELPKTFNPRKFHPQDWAALAKLAGMRYVVFTSKHHNGFCMWPTATTPFNIAQTPFRRDITGDIVKAFRDQGLSPGLYFSPDDFWWLSRNGKPIQRNVPAVFPANNPGLMRHDQAQVRELLTRYGPIDFLFFDGPAEGLRDLAWKLQPNVVVTRGAIRTPEQYIPGVPMDEPWEANLTMGTEWSYKPANDVYKSGGELIGTLIETRAKGGNLLLNVGPKPDGEIPIEQEERLREMALWMYVNGESIYGVRPWVVTNEGDYWFTKKKNENTVYVFVKERERWRYGSWKDLTLRSVRATEKTEVSVLGQNDRILEYRPDVIPKTTWKQDAQGLHVRAMHAQRLYTDRRWPNPTVLKITQVEPALAPPRVVSRRGTWSNGAATLEGEILDLGKAESVEAGFEYRVITGQDTSERLGNWRTAGALERRTATGPFHVTVTEWKPGEQYEFRAVVRHPLLTVYGKEISVTTR